MRIEAALLVKLPHYYAGVFTMWKVRLSVHILEAATVVKYPLSSENGEATPD